MAEAVKKERDLVVANLAESGTEAKSEKAGGERGERERKVYQKAGQTLCSGAKSAGLIGASGEISSGVVWAAEALSAALVAGLGGVHDAAEPSRTRTRRRHRAGTRRQTVRLQIRYLTHRAACHQLALLPPS